MFDINSFDNFNNIGLAQRLQGHVLLEFRRLAAYLYKVSYCAFKLAEPKIDTELAYTYVKTDRLHDMEDFLSMTNVADILEVGEKCFEDELYQVAKLLFTSISNWARLATTLIYLGENQAAVESARKAGNTQ